MKSLAAILIIFLFTLAAGAQSTTISLSENFNSTTFWDQANSTLVWNPYFHMLHTPLEISYTWNANIEDSNDASVGNGQDGAFDVGTYASFGSVVGNTLTINTNVHPVLQVTYFNLASGWTIQGIGSNPLWIKSMGPATISGLINCNGDDGQPSDFVTTSATIGGSGHCGGGNGGNGGFFGAAATAGASGGGTTTGGAPGNQGNIGAGGGGGGGYRGSAVGQPTAGVAGGAAAGGAGTCQPDPKFTVFGVGVGGGGAGGGGGGYDTVGLSRGASGGAGGGVVRITAVGDITVNAGGKIWTKGGTGGGATGGAHGGGGGGGAGGGIWLQSAGNIVDNGTIDAGVHSGAPDGNNAGVVPGGANGGTGSDGRTWLTLDADTASPPSETPQSELLTFYAPFHEGIIHFSVAGAGYVGQSLSYDSGNTAPLYSAFSMVSSLPGTATASILIAGSNDNFVSDNTGFLPATSLTSFAGKRFFKFKITLVQDSTLIPASTASSVTAVNTTYIGHVQTSFQFTQSCGYIAGGPPEELFLLGLFGLIYFLFSSRARRFRFARLSDL